MPLAMQWIVSFAFALFVVACFMLGFFYLDEHDLLAYVPGCFVGLGFLALVAYFIKLAVFGP